MTAGADATLEDCDLYGNFWGGIAVIGGRLVGRDLLVHKSHASIPDPEQAPGYGIVTTITGCSTSGIWFTRSFCSASSPRHMSAMMMTIVATGRLMLKSERSIG